MTTLDGVNINSTCNQCNSVMPIRKEDHWIIKGYEDKYQFCSQNCSYNFWYENLKGD